MIIHARYMTSSCAKLLLIPRILNIKTNPAVIINKFNEDSSARTL